jgi:hypothetical protein
MWIPYKMESFEDFFCFQPILLDEQRRGLTVPFATFEQKFGTNRRARRDT